ncbi:MAG: hypothetical protein JSW11_09335 [Candidatus Heimdallarchaeota archaeon]|nr:MAG: hypothetical protein JSW11_09335 [Candidatus Heimdallarchaeota archaeon]
MTPTIISYFGFGVFLLELLVSIFIFFRLSKRWRETKITVVSLLAGAYLLLFILMLIEFWFFLINFNDPVGFYLQEDNIFVWLFPFFGGISGGFFMLFIDYFENERINPIHGFFYGAFLGAFILNVMYQIVIPEVFPVSTTETNTLFLLFLNFLFSTNFPASYFVIYVIIVTLGALRRIKNSTEDELQKRQVTLMQWSIILYYLVTLVIIAGAYQLEELLNPNLVVFLKHIAPHINVILGSVMIFQAYVKAPVGFLQFQNIEKLLVINRSGLLLFSHNFTVPKGDSSSEKDLLLSGGVHAILNLFTEMINTENIRMIQFLDKKIMLSQNENFIIFLLVDRISSFLWSALDSFGTMFNLKYGLEDQEYAVVIKNFFDEAESLLKIAFGRQ